MRAGRAFHAAVILMATAGVAFAADTPPDQVKFEDFAVSQPIAEEEGDPDEGVKVFTSRRLGNCLACHTVSSLSNEQFHGTVAPPLDGVADRWEPAQLRAIVIDAKQVFGDQSVMPGFYSLHTGIDVREEFVGKTILNAQQVEDVVAYLSTLSESR